MPYLLHLQMKVLLYLLQFQYYCSSLYLFLQHVSKSFFFFPDCTSLTCSEPLTNGPPGSPCVCVIPMQVGLRLSVALYTFFPLVSELASEIATGVFLKPSQVRIMGANAAGQDPEKTIVLTDLVPLGEKFDNTTAYLTFQRFWHKKVVINTSLFGDYEVLYVHYPGDDDVRPFDWFHFWFLISDLGIYKCC